MFIAYLMLDDQTRQFVREEGVFCLTDCFGWFSTVQRIINFSAVPEVVIFQMVSLEMFYTS